MVTEPTDGVILVTNRMHNVINAFDTCVPITSLGPPLEPVRVTGQASSYLVPTEGGSEVDLTSSLILPYGSRCTSTCLVVVFSFVCY